MAENNSSNIEDYKIWYPHEIFYIESMLTIAKRAMSAQTDLQAIIGELENGRPKIHDDTDFIIDNIQNILVDAAALSRYFWPSRNKDKDKDKIHQLRGQRLREAFDINEGNPLQKRQVRNFIEHFDENLDIYLLTPPAGDFIPATVGSRNKSPQAINHYFRAFNTDDWTFEALGVEVKILPIINEIIRIYLLLDKYRNEGGRLPKSNP